MIAICFIRQRPYALTMNKLFEADTRNNSGLIHLPYFFKGFFFLSQVLDYHDYADHGSSLDFLCDRYTASYDARGNRKK